ncbi:MAG: ATP-binding protein [Acidobacteriota bacterium]
MNAIPSELAASGSTPSSGAPSLELVAEWNRLETLAHCLSEARQDREVPSSTLASLRTLQHEVNELRGEGWRAVVGDARLSDLEHDVLACAVAPEALPRLGSLFQGLQQGGSPQPYPTGALLFDLLALAPEDAPRLHRALAETSPLRRRGLIRIEGDDLFQPVRPGIGITARLLGGGAEEPAPPGATRVDLRADWDELILPAEHLAMLREFLLWIQHRDLVLEEWGGRSCGGPVALFAGPSGTGKTFAASVLASELGWPLYRIDLGTLVSKYIGETEKNLNRLFDAAHGRPMVLQFDEADSLFSKRGEVKEARDRYANMEVSHLLARIEAHHGPCVLTTNLRSNLDQAFARRFQIVVDFPRPDQAARARLWQSLLPPRAPRAEEVDPEALAGAVNLTGGQIRNAALHAAYLAAGNGRMIAMPHIALAVWRELGKDGRDLTASDLGALAAHLPVGGVLC